MGDRATDGRQPVFVLVRPQMGENIGAAARAMWNFGLDRMRVVNARDGWPNPRAVALASGAGRLLDDARHHQRLSDALGDCTFTFATTARPRDLTKPVFSPRGRDGEGARFIRARSKSCGAFRAGNAPGWKTMRWRGRMR